MRRNRLRIYLHFVWATKNREPIITPAIEGDLHRYVAAVCEDDRCRLLALGGIEDHIHLVVAFPSTITVADLVRDVKGGSSREIGAEVRPDEWFAWQENYGATSISPGDLKMLVRYVRSQKQHHATGELIRFAEETDEEAQVSAVDSTRRFSSSN